MKFITHCFVRVVLLDNILLSFFNHKTTLNETTMGFKNDLTGKVFGRLTVIEFSHNGSNWSVHWKCRCSCGRILWCGIIIYFPGTLNRVDVKN